MLRRAWSLVAAGGVRYRLQFADHIVRACLCCYFVGEHPPEERPVERWCRRPARRCRAGRLEEERPRRRRHQRCRCCRDDRRDLLVRYFMIEQADLHRVGDAHDFFLCCCLQGGHSVHSVREVRRCALLGPNVNSRRENGTNVLKIKQRKRGGEAHGRRERGVRLKSLGDLLVLAFGSG